MELDSDSSCGYHLALRSRIDCSKQLNQSLENRSIEASGLQDVTCHYLINNLSELLSERLRSIENLDNTVKKTVLVP